MYDLIDIIDTKLSGMEHLINKWMINNQLIKSSLLNDIKSIQSNINQYHNKYVICKNWTRYGQCKYGAHCWYYHPINNNNDNNNSRKRKEKNSEFSGKNFQENSDVNENDLSHDSIDSEFYESNSDNSDASDDGDNGIESEISPKLQTAKKKHNRKRKRKRKKQWKAKETIDNDIAETKNFFNNKQTPNSIETNIVNERNEYLKNSNKYRSWPYKCLPDIPQKHVVARYEVLLEIDPTDAETNRWQEMTFRERYELAFEKLSEIPLEHINWIIYASRKHKIGIKKIHHILIANHRKTQHGVS